jgi:hypothetical protein
VQLYPDGFRVSVVRKKKKKKKKNTLNFYIMNGLMSSYNILIAVMASNSPVLLVTAVLPARMIIELPTGMVMRTGDEDHR